MSESGIVLIAGFIGVVMYVQLVVNTGRAWRALERIETLMKERDGLS